MQIINKDENRVRYFDLLLKTILNVVKLNPDSKRIFLKPLYDFCITKAQDKHIFSPIKSEYLRKYFYISDNDLNNQDSMIPVQNFKGWDDIYITIDKMESFKGYIQLQQQCLFVYKSRNVFNYLLVIPLYKAYFDVYRVDLENNNEMKFIEPQEIYDIFSDGDDYSEYKLDIINSEIIIRIYHPFEKFEFYVKFSVDYKIFQVKNFIKILDKFLNIYNPKSTLISRITRNNINIYGSLLVEIDSLTLKDYNGECFMNVSLSPYFFNTNSMKNNQVFPINQMYLFPIHNRFGTLKIQIVGKNKEGIFKTDSKELLGEFTIELPEILNYIFFPDKFIEVNLKNINNKKLSSGTLILRIKDYTFPLALIEKNRNKKILEDMMIEDDDLGISSFLKRLNRMVVLFKDLNVYYKTLFRFKYPIFSGILMFLTISFLLICDSQYIVTHLVFICIIIMIKNSYIYHKYLSPFVDKYIFSYRNPYDFNCKYLTTIKKNQDSIERPESYLIEKEKFDITNIITEPLKVFDDFKNKYEDLLLRFSDWVGFCEKVKNLIYWTDPLLSLYFLIILIAVYLFIYHIDLKYLLLFSYTKKFIIGMFYYKVKYDSNKEILRIVLEYCLKDWRKQHGQIKSTIDFRNIKIFDEKFKFFIKETIEKETNLVFLKEEIFNTVYSLGEIQDELAKCNEIIKIKKTSKLFYYSNDNPKVYKSPDDIEDYFYYFVQNIKSDFYLVRHGLVAQNEKRLVHQDRIFSLDSENFFKNQKEKED
jgi:hypothetical protein